MYPLIILQCQQTMILKHLRLAKYNWKLVKKAAPPSATSHSKKTGLPHQANRPHRATKKDHRPHQATKKDQPHQAPKKHHRAHQTTEKDHRPQLVSLTLVIPLPEASWTLVKKAAPPTSHSKKTGLPHQANRPHRATKKDHRAHQATEKDHRPHQATTSPARLGIELVPAARHDLASASLKPPRTGHIPRNSLVKKLKPI